MTETEYDAICGRIEKADSLPASVREEYQEVYNGLTTQALQYEFGHKRFPLYMVKDESVRMIVEALLRDHAALLAAGSAQEYRAQALRVLAACMALVAEDADKALPAFGYKEAGA